MEPWIETKIEHHENNLAPSLKMGLSEPLFPTENFQDFPSRKSSSFLYYYYHRIFHSINICRRELKLIMKY